MPCIKIMVTLKFIAPPKNPGFGFPFAWKCICCVHEFYDGSCCNFTFCLAPPPPFLLTPPPLPHGQEKNLDLESLSKITC